LRKRDGWLKRETTTKKDKNELGGLGKLEIFWGKTIRLANSEKKGETTERGSAGGQFCSIAGGNRVRLSLYTGGI